MGETSLSNDSCNSERKFISDIIKADYLQWENEKIIVNSGTATGKTTFILDTLAKHAESNNKMILYLCNRSSLKKQIKERIRKDNIKSVIVMTYQTLEESLLKIAEIPFQIDYIVADEAHYFFGDALFNHNTDVSYNYLLNIIDCSVIYMSATADYFFKMLLNQEIVKPNRVYELKKDYSYIQEVNFFWQGVINSLF